VDILRFLAEAGRGSGDARAARAGDRCNLNVTMPAGSASILWGDDDDCRIRYTKNMKNEGFRQARRFRSINHTWANVADRVT
jgi:hypothetical protein